MDRHEGGEPETGGDHPLDKGMGFGLGLAVGASNQRLEATFLAQPAEPEDGKFEGHFSLEGGHGLSGRTFGGFLLMGFIRRRGGETEIFSLPVISGHFRTFRNGGGLQTARE